MEAIGSNIFMGPGGSQSYDRFKDEYQARTGDPTADPFLGLGDRNAARVYNQAAADSWTQHQQLLQGRVPTIAGTAMMGPQSPAVTAARTAAAPVATMQSGGDMDQQAANLTLYKMNHPEYMDPSMAGNPVFRSIQKSLGAGGPSDADAFRSFQATGRLPEATPYQTTAETNKESVNYGLDTNVLNDPEFKKALETNPILAARAYESLTGIPYKNVMDIQAGRKKDRETLDDMMVSRLANDLTKDENGNWGKYMRVKKTPGALDKYLPGGGVPEYVDKVVPLNDIEKKWLESGAFTRKTGISLDQIEQKRAQELTPAQAQNPKVKARYDQVLKSTGDPATAKRIAELEAKGSPDYLGQMGRDVINDPNILLDTGVGMAKSVGDFFMGLGHGASNMPR